MPNGLEGLVVPVVAELLQNAAVSAVKYFRDRGKSDDEAKEAAKQALYASRGFVESAAEEIIGSALPDKQKDQFHQLVEDTVSVLPIQEGIAMVTIARYTEIPVNRIQQSDAWMSDDRLLRTATSHAWIESLCEKCLTRLGYGIEKGQQLRDGVVNLWTDIIAKSPQEPAHVVAVDIVSTSESTEHRVAALLYDMETAELLKEDHWFFLATHALFIPTVKGIIDRANARAPYKIATLGASELKQLIEAHDDPARLLELMRSYTGG